MSDNIRVCETCSEEKNRYDEIDWHSEEQKYICHECTIKESLLKWTKLVCPIMNRSPIKRDMVMCQTTSCPSFERIKGYYYCHLIDFDMFLG
jgi:hypothetical protein